MSFSGCVDRYFGVSVRGSTFQKEVWGGVVVFMSMCYVIAVNPSMMTDAGMDRGACYTATTIMAVIGSLSMALYARHPMSQAPLMGANVFFIYIIVAALGFTWQQALVATFIAGMAFLVITLTGLRDKLADSIANTLRHAVVAGVGCFIVFIGLKNVDLIVTSDGVTALGNLAEPAVLLGVFCILLTLFLYARRPAGAVLLGMVVTAVVGIVTGIIPLPSEVVSVPEMPDFGAFLDGFSADLLSVEFLVVVTALTFMQFFDSAGTLMAAGELAGFEGREGKALYDRAMVANAASTAMSGIVGCTPTGPYAESFVGIESGAKTGLASLVVAVLFFMALFIGPLFGIITSSCTVGAMVVVGAAMITSLKNVSWDDWPQAVSAMGTVLFMVLSFSIVNGIAFGAIFYCVCMVGARRWKEVSPVMYGLAAFSLVYFITISAVIAS